MKNQPNVSKSTEKDKTGKFLNKVKWTGTCPYADCGKTITSEVLVSDANLADYGGCHLVCHAHTDADGDSIDVMVLARRESPLAVPAS